MRARRGLSLAELLVAMGLAAIVLAIATSLIWQAVRTTARGTVSGELYQSGVTALTWLVEDIQSTGAAGIGVLNSGGPATPTVLSVHPLADVSNQLVRFYDDHIVVYVWDPATGILTRSTWPPGPPTLGVTLEPANPWRPDDTQLLALTANNGTRRQLATQVTAFEFENPAGVDFPNIGQPLKLKLSLSRKAAAGYQPEKFEVERLITLRNGL
ncbi:MAG: prepilin-type N-terminal cleavage/methylation domain-containing protein [Candidatus Eremiobacteraeota bacterium]|nr:prepilin-type N-terminal cleavage/methylation domain-containing protein [Candidatus Eremiobacteraeota bacterium]